MKKRLSILFLLPFTIFSQLYFSEFNATKGLVTGKGYLFNDFATSLPSYEVPKTAISNTNSLFITSLLSMAKVNNILKGVGSTYSNHELISGPIANDYNAGNYIAKYTSLWPVYALEINQHIQNWNQVGYVIPSSILNWPGNGDVSNGEAQILAPFQDLNSNQIYEPTLGEYPLIRGDAAVYSILNDENCSHIASNLSPLKQEIHLMVYQYATNDCLNQTTFLHFQIFNRSLNIFDEYKFGLFNDYDLGNFADDYIGSDSNLSLSYVYNADSNDESNGNAEGYGLNPPAFGFMELNHNLSSNLKLNATNNNTQLFNNLNGLNGDGTSLLDGSSNTTTYNYDNSVNSGWTEKGISNVPGDRNSVLGTTTCTLNPNESICRDFAMIYARASSYVTGLESVDLLKLNAETVQNFYDTQSFSCMNSVGVKEITNSHYLTVYPNPTEKTVTVSIEGEFSYSIVGIDGKLILKGKTKDSEINVEALNSGIYYLEVISDKGTSTTQFTKK